jgi:hypothetical protein
MVERRFQQLLGQLPLFHSNVPDFFHARRPLAREGAANRLENTPSLVSTVAIEPCIETTTGGPT